MPRLFGSSGIRGPYGDPITPEQALTWGQGAGSLAKRILVGHDVRFTSPLLAQAFIAGALSQGAGVTTCGAAATPSIAYGARGHDLSVVVTASHNPAPDNGFKFWNPDGSAWNRASEQAFEAAIAHPKGHGAAWNTIQPITFDAGVTKRHADAILKHTPSARGQDVVVDCGNGAGAYITPQLLENAGHNVTPIATQPDGRFPSRPSEPSPENLATLSDECRRRNAWGIAHDGDADRMVAVATDGHVVPSHIALAAIARFIHARNIVVPIDAPLQLRTLLPEATFSLCPVGDAYVSAAVSSQRADLGAETSGTYVIPSLSLAPDGPLAAHIMLLAAAEGLVDELRQRDPTVTRLSHKLPLNQRRREDVRSKLIDTEFADDDCEVTRLDGVRVDAPDGWFLIRLSGTEPLLRVTVEAQDRERARDLEDVGLSFARRILDDETGAAAQV